LDALDGAKARATFFIVGARAESSPDIVRRMAASGYDVENHSYSHPNIAQCLPDTVESELLRANVIIRGLTGRYPRFFRPPGGNASRTLARLADRYGMKLAFWSVDALKAEDESSVTGLVGFVMKRVKPGSIILLHNGPDVTTAAVPTLVKSLRAQGYELVTLRQLAQEPVHKAKPAEKRLNVARKI
jgi:peptidoglycan/xylan/chitin deacetylase (PgdA/CDA1 family)